MAREFPASKTQIRKAEELGIDISDNPGYTTLGARLEAAGWNAKGTEQMTETSFASASASLESRKAYQEWKQQPRSVRLHAEEARYNAQQRRLSGEDQGERWNDDQGN